MDSNSTNCRVEGFRRWHETDRALVAALMRRFHEALNREGVMGGRPSWAGRQQEEAEALEVEVEAMALARASGSPSEAQEQSELGAQAAAAQEAAAAAEVAAGGAAAAGAAAQAPAEARALADSSALEDDQMELEDEGDAMEEEEAGDAAAAAAAAASSAFACDRGLEAVVDDQGFQEGEEEIGLEEEGERVAVAAAPGPFHHPQLPLEGAFGVGGSASGNGGGGDGGSGPGPSPLLFSVGVGPRVPSPAGATGWLAPGGAGAPYAGPRGSHWKRGVKRPREEQSRGFANGLEGNQSEPAQAAGTAAAPPQQLAQGRALSPPGSVVAPQEQPVEPSAFGLGRRMRLVLLGNRGPN